MNCRNFLRHFSAYLDGELGREALSESEAHLDRCEKCVRHVAAYRQGIEQFHQLPGIEPPANLSIRVKQASLSDPAPMVFRPRRIRFMIPAAAAAVIAVALTVTFIGISDKGRFAYDIGAADSTMDVVNLQLTRNISWKSRATPDRSRKIMQLASYTPDENGPFFSYPVNPKPVFVLSGVVQTVE